MQRTSAGNSADAGEHNALEDAWAQVGVLSSVKKRLSGATAVQELGAHLQGASGTIGPDRLLRLIQVTLVCIGRKRLKHKWIQVIAGRWVHCMSFKATSYGSTGCHMELSVWQADGAHF